jgi:hypothetical protein
MGLNLAAQIRRYNLQNLRVGVEFSSEESGETAGGIDFGSLNEDSMLAKFKLEWMIHAEVRNLQAEL